MIRNGIVEKFLYNKKWRKEYLMIIGFMSFFVLFSMVGMSKGRLQGFKGLITSGPFYLVAIYSLTLYLLSSGYVRFCSSSMEIMQLRKKSCVNYDEIDGVHVKSDMIKLYTNKHTFSIPVVYKNSSRFFA